MKIGAYTGKFYPPHIGHLSAVDFSLKHCDEVIIIISKNVSRNKSLEDDGFEILDAELIKSWFVEYYKNEPRVKVAIFDESNFRPYPEDQDVWVEKFKKEFPTVNVKIADESYRQFNDKYFPECEFLPLDRDIIPIHSTMLRNNMTEYFDYLIPTAKDYFRGKI